MKIKKITKNMTYRRRYTQRGGIFGAISSLSNYAISTWNTLSTLASSALVKIPVDIINILRMSKSIVEDTNDAYRYYRYVATIDVDKLPRPISQVTKTRFVKIKNDLNKLLLYIKNTAISIRLCGIAYAYFTGNSDAYSKEVASLNAIEATENNPLHPLYPVRLKKIFDISMVAFYGDWYRYELNILMTKLVAVVHEITATAIGLPQIGDIESVTNPFISSSSTPIERSLSSYTSKNSFSLRRRKRKNS
jgi:hypothetical protein